MAGASKEKAGRITDGAIHRAPSIVGGGDQNGGKGVCGDQYKVQGGRVGRSRGRQKKSQVRGYGRSRVEGKRETKKRSQVEGKKESLVEGSRVRGEIDRFEGVYHTETVKGVDNQYGEWGDGSQSIRRGDERKIKEQYRGWHGIKKKMDTSYTGKRKEREESDKAN